MRCILIAKSPYVLKHLGIPHLLTSYIPKVILRKIGIMVVEQKKDEDQMVYQQDLVPYGDEKNLWYRVEKESEADSRDLVIYLEEMENPDVNLVNLFSVSDGEVVTSGTIEGARWGMMIIQPNGTLRICPGDGTTLSYTNQGATLHLQSSPPAKKKRS